MSILSGISDFFGLDIGTTAVRLVQLQGNYPKTLVKYAYVPVDPKISLSDAKSDQMQMAQIIIDLCSQAKMTTRNVVVGLPTKKIFTTIVDMDKVSPRELEKTIMFQADSLIPTPIGESKLDWALLGDSPKDSSKIEVLLSSVSDKYVESKLDSLESVGLNVIAFEPENIAILRALISPGTTAPILVLDIGSLGTDLIITMNETPRLARSIAVGTQAIIKSAAQNLNIDNDQAQQFIFKFGLDPSKLDGQLSKAIENTIEILNSEIEKSIKFFENRYSGKQIEKIIITGGASLIPNFAINIANRFNMNVEIGNAWHNVSFPESRQGELLSVANQFSVAVGLAGRNE
jgi:type IV pilus assembly protein PilM